MSTRSDPDETRIRLRAILDAQFTLLVVLCVVLAAVGGFVVYGTYVEPGTETETREVSSWTVDTEHLHAAEVTEENTVFEVGSTLENRDTYFARIAPELDVAVETDYAAAQAEDVRIEAESELVISNAGDGVVYWEERETIAETAGENVDPDEPIATEFTLDSAALDQQASEIEEELGASPGQTEIEVVTSIELDGTINGEPETFEREMTFGIDHAGDTYSVDDPGVESETVPQEVTEEVERTYGPLRSIGGPFLLVIGVVAGAGLSYARYEGILEVSEAERAYLSYSDDRSEFDEWITRIRLPAEAHDRPEGSADSLRDLVDFAIDSETGVIEDPETGAFHAFTEEFVYTYRPPDPPEPTDLLEESTIGSLVDDGSSDADDGSSDADDGSSDADGPADLDTGESGGTTGADGPTRETDESDDPDTEDDHADRSA